VQAQVGVAGDGAVVAELRVQVERATAPSISVVSHCGCDEHRPQDSRTSITDVWSACTAAGRQRSPTSGFRSMQVVPSQRADARASAASERAKAARRRASPLLYTWASNRER